MAEEKKNDGHTYHIGVIEDFDDQGKTTGYWATFVDSDDPDKVIKDEQIWPENVLLLRIFFTQS